MNVGKETPAREITRIILEIKLSQESDCKTDYIAVQLKERKPQLKICTAVKGLVEIGVKDNDFEMETTGNVWYKLEVDM